MESHQRGIHSQSQSCVGIFKDFQKREKQADLLIYKNLFPVNHDSGYKFGNIGTLVTVFASTCTGIGAKPRGRRLARNGYRCCDDCHTLGEKRRHKIYQTVKDRAVKARRVKVALKRQDCLVDEGE